MSFVEIKELESLSTKQKREIICRSSISIEDVTKKIVRPLYQEVCKAPLDTLKKYGKKWDGCIPSKILLDRVDLKLAFDKIEKQNPEILEAFKKAYDNIYNFHIQQKPQNFQTTIKDNILGFKFQPFDTVCLYVPGGKALYPSTVLMGIIPAVIAGVKNINIITPPNSSIGQVSETVQAMAYLAGASSLLQSGGAQSILAAAIGIEEINFPAADFIYGPGNRFVAAAKSFVFANNLCGIDSFAGPSEVVIIADESANPKYLAHDLLAQAEHDEDAIAILLCTDKKIAQECSLEINKAIDKRDSVRKKIAQKSIQNNGKIFIVKNLEDAVAFSNEFAPEHLEIQTLKNQELLAKITAAGSIFLGEYSPVAVGDYYSGTNHILPTAGAARFASGVSVHSFYRRITWQECSRKGLEQSQTPITIMSKEEGLFDEHGYSVLTRFEE